MILSSSLSFTNIIDFKIKWFLRIEDKNKKRNSGDGKFSGISSDDFFTTDYNNNNGNQHSTWVKEDDSAWTTNKAKAKENQDVNVVRVYIYILLDAYSQRLFYISPRHFAILPDSKYL